MLRKKKKADILVLEPSNPDILIIEKSKAEIESLEPSTPDILALEQSTQILDLNTDNIQDKSMIPKTNKNYNNNTAPNMIYLGPRKMSFKHQQAT